MIIEWLIQLGVAIANWVMGTLPDTSSAANLVFTADDAFSPVIAGGAALGPWIPWAHLGATILVCLGLYLLLFLCKIARQLLTHLPLFGGTG